MGRSAIDDVSGVARVKLKYESANGSSFELLYRPESDAISQSNTPQILSRTEPASLSQWSELGTYSLTQIYLKDIAGNESYIVGRNLDSFLNDSVNNDFSEIRVAMEEDTTSHSPEIYSPTAYIIDVAESPSLRTSVVVGDPDNQSVYIRPLTPEDADRYFGLDIEPSIGFGWGLSSQDRGEYQTREDGFVYLTYNRSIDFSPPETSHGELALGQFNAYAALSNDPYSLGPDDTYVRFTIEVIDSSQPTQPEQSVPGSASETDNRMTVPVVSAQTTYLSAQDYRHTGRADEANFIILPGYFSDAINVINQNGDISWSALGVNSTCNADMNALLSNDGLYLNLNTQFTTDLTINSSLFRTKAVVSNEYVAGVIAGSISISTSDLDQNGVLDTVFSNSSNNQTFSLLNFDWYETGIDMVGVHPGGVVIEFL